jgi:hypothetical protein
MSLFAQWKDQLENQTEDTFDEFWEKYSSGETKIYSEILKEGSADLTGSIKDLSVKFGVDSVIFMGFLDGINTSLKTGLDLESLSEDDHITLSIDFEKLYFNMLKAQADYLFLLEQWDDVLTKEKRNEIAKEYKKSKTLVKEKAPGRNDPCPCGSG